MPSGRGGVLLGMTIGVWIALAAVGVALAFGVYRAMTDGRFRGTHAVSGAGTSGSDTATETVDGGGGVAAPDVAEAVAADGLAVEAASPVLLDLLPVGTPRGERATLLQFSSAFCAPCRATRRVLGEVAGVVPGVVHVELDAEHHLELVRELGVLRTPTTLILDAAGREIARAAGAPRKEQVLGALPTV